MPRDGRRWSRRAGARRPRTTRQTPSEPVEILRELVRKQALRCAAWSASTGMPYWLQIIAGRHLAAEAVAAVGDGHLARGIRGGLDQHRHIEAGEAQASAMARSSPKLGRVTMTPSMSSRCLRNSSAQRRASSNVSTAPYFVLRA